MHNLMTDLGMTDYPVRKNKWNPGPKTQSKIKEAIVQYLPNLWELTKGFLNGTPKAKAINEGLKAHDWVQSEPLVQQTKHKMEQDENKTKNL